MKVGTQQSWFLVVHNPVWSNHHGGWARGAGSHWEEQRPREKLRSPYNQGATSNGCGPLKKHHRGRGREMAQSYTGMRLGVAALVFTVKTGYNGTLL